MCITNHALGGQNQELRDLRKKADGKVQQLEALVAEKDENLKSVATELEITQKVLQLLNNGTNMLNHLITSDKSFGDHSGADFKGEFSNTKTVFIKSELFTDSVVA